MGKVLWHATISLDGFIAGPHDAMEWVFDHAGPNPAAARVTAETGALLAGAEGSVFEIAVPPSAAGRAEQACFCEASDQKRLQRRFAKACQCSS
jgi:hypothetical protein